MIPSQTILIYILIATTVLLFIAVIILTVKFKKVLKGKNAETLEDSINHLANETKDLVQFRKELEEYMTTVEKRLKKSIQAVETVRFNAFKGNGEGGNQSFATAFISEKGDGVVMSSLYSRDRVSIFSKPISNYKSEFELTSEESKTVNKAREACKSS